MTREDRIIYGVLVGFGILLAYVLVLFMSAGILWYVRRSRKLAFKKALFLTHTRGGLIFLGLTWIIALAFGITYTEMPNLFVIEWL